MLLWFTVIELCFRGMHFKDKKMKQPFYYGFHILRIGLRLRKEATSYMYVAVLHRNRTLLQSDVF